jgi:hypothetical protein
MTTLLLRYGAWRIAWTALACGVVLIVAISPAFGASRTGGPEHQSGDNQSCAVSGATPTPVPTPEADEANEANEANEVNGAEGAEADDQGCPEATPARTPRPTRDATPRPTPRPTAHHTAKPPKSGDNQTQVETDNETEQDNESGD